MIETYAFAKINLFLDIESVRPDTYHNIVSVMQTIDWTDTIYIETQSSEMGIRLSCSENGIPIDEKNTAHKAARLFLKRTGITEGLAIHIDKQIPHAAGLAGGSADAAAVLLGLNKLFDFPLKTDELLKIGAQIGADVPFCVAKGTALATGIGEKLESLLPLPPCYIVCAKAGEGVSTPQAYAQLDRDLNFFQNYSVHTENLTALCDALVNSDISRLPGGVFNIFESILEPQRPYVSLLKDVLRSHHAIVAMMSGSGPSVFGIFDNLSAAAAANEQLLKIGAISRVCHPISSIS